MDPASIFLGYFSWHYGKAFSQMAVLFANLYWFIGHFFSVGTLLRTLFSPWKRIFEFHHRGEGAEAYFAIIVVNILSRIVGAFVRLIFIFIGLLTTVLMTIGICAVIVFWLFAPFVLTLAFVFGVRMLI